MISGTGQVTIVLLLLCCACVPTAAAPGVDSGLATADRAPLETTAAASLQNETARPDPDTTVTRIDVYENGSAVWTIRVRTRLDDEESVDEFEHFQSQFEDREDEFLDPFRNRMTGVVANAEEATGREMRAESFGVETSMQEVPRRWGVVTYSFRWENFARTDGDAVVVGDVFEGGLYLAPDDSLVVERPADYDHVSSSPPPDEVDGDDLVWNGSEDFEDREPTVRFEPTGEGARTESAPSSTPDADRRAVPWGPVALLLVVGIGALYLGRRTGVPISIPFEGFGSERPVSPDGNEPEGSATAAADAAGTSPGDRVVPEDADSGVPSDDTDDEKLLTDEDHVRQLLRNNDGRLRQTTIADELGWSASKASRVLSSMATAGTVDKLRIGRENVIDLDDGASEGDEDE